CLMYRQLREHRAGWRRGSLQSVPIMHRRAGLLLSLWHSRMRKHVHGALRRPGRAILFPRLLFISLKPREPFAHPKTIPAGQSRVPRDPFASSQPERSLIKFRRSNSVTRTWIAWLILSLAACTRQTPRETPPAAVADSTGHTSPEVAKKAAEQLASATHEPPPKLPPVVPEVVAHGPRNQMRVALTFDACST